MTHLTAMVSSQQTLAAPTEGGEDDDTTVEGREGASIPGGGGDDASDSDDDLEVTWDVDSPKAARYVGVVAASGKPETARRLKVRCRRERVPHLLLRHYLVADR